MNGKQDGIEPLDRGFGFFGAITASLSHEINNVLAIINELSGLMGDFVAAADQGQPLDPERMKGSLSRISTQIERGKAHVKQLNTFAHSVDEPESSFDACEQFDLIVAVCQRFATLKKVTLDGACGEKPIPVEGCRFDLQHAIYRCLDLVLGTAPEGSAVNISIEPHEKGFLIEARGSQSSEHVQVSRSKLEPARKQIELLGGKLEARIEDGLPVGASVVLPRKMGRLAFER